MLSLRTVKSFPFVIASLHPRISHLQTKVKIESKRMKSSKIVPAKRYDGVDKNVWSEFTALAAEHKAVNVGQGFPDFSPPEFVKKALSDAAALSSGNLAYQYTRGFGHPKLVTNIARLFSPLFGVTIDPMKEVLISIGGYGALFSSLNCFVEDDDEVIIVEPFFDCYKPMAKVARGITKFIPLRPPADCGEGPSTSGDWTLNKEELESMFNDKTKVIVINTPNNPLGKVYKREELQMIADLCIKHDVLCISDEVYEWVLFDDHKHVRIASLPGMWDRTITIGSAGKTFSVTGWKIGWAIGPEHLVKHLFTVSQNTVYTCPTPIQEAVANCFEVEISRQGTEDSYFVQLPRELQAKRDLMAKVLTELGMKPIIPQGGYFMIADASNMSVDLSESEGSGEAWDYRLVKWLTKHKKVATIPATAFYSTEHRSMADRYIRFCFCKEDKTINDMADIFRSWAKSM